MAKSLRTLALAIPMLMACARSSPDYPSFIGKTKKEVITYCGTSTRRYLDNKIMILVPELHYYLYFSNEDEALRSADLTQYHAWCVDFRDRRFSIRRDHLELRFQNGVVVSQQPGFTSDL